MLWCKRKSSAALRGEAKPRHATPVENSRRVMVLMRRVVLCILGFGLRALGFRRRLWFREAVLLHGDGDVFSGLWPQQPPRGRVPEGGAAVMRGARREIWQSGLAHGEGLSLIHI